MNPFDCACNYYIAGSYGVDERFAVVLASSTGGLARAPLEPCLGTRGWSVLVDEV